MNDNILVKIITDKQSHAQDESEIPKKRRCESLYYDGIQTREEDAEYMECHISSKQITNYIMALFLDSFVYVVMTHYVFRFIVNCKTAYY